MQVKRIVPNIAANGAERGLRFYRDVLGLEVVMDLGWIVTLAAGEQSPVQVSIASEGGSDTPVPDLSIEVDDVEVAYSRMRAAGFAIEYPMTEEPWGVLRFYSRDPYGRLVNVMSHS